jgi:phosphoenolpyruvate synthase/pyruvate phosphate dikinase
LSKYIGYFQDIDYDNVRQYGGKSCSLGEMLQSGISVPTGFAIGIEAQLEFQDKPFSNEFKKELSEAFRKLNLKLVAVRSSAIAEDAADASWAGQLESYLNVTQDQLEGSIRKCWDSINTDHAVAYGAGKGLSKEDLLVGVAVQSMAPSEVAGVMFTVDPITGDRRRMIIEGLYGLGEMLVQGIITPDRYVVERSPLQIIDFDIQVKEQQMVYKQGKNRIVAVPSVLQDRAVLKESRVLQLAELGLKIEKHYGKPQDVEWGYVKGQFYILQARPITTLN